MQEYSGDQYMQIRAVQQTGSYEEAKARFKERKLDDDLHPDEYKRIKGMADDLDAFHAVAEPTPGTVYRGLAARPEVMQKFLTSDTFTTDASTSTLILPSVAEGFVGVGAGGSIVMVMKQKSGHAIRPFSTNKSEHEILVPKGVQFRITKRERHAEEPGILVVHMEEV